MNYKNKNYLDVILSEVEESSISHASKIEKTLANLIKGWVFESATIYKHRLCCEIYRITLDKAIELTMKFYHDKSDNFYLVMCDSTDHNAIIIANVAALDTIVTRLFEREQTFSLVNLSTYGGCTFDLTESDDTLYEFLVIAWGESEGYSEKISQFVPTAHLFRGN